MKRPDLRLPALPVLLAGAIVATLVARPARALDFGWGLFGGFNYVPSPGDFVNDMATIRAQQGRQARPSHAPLSGNPNSFHNRLRDDSFIPSYNVGSRRPPAYQPAPRVSPGLTSHASTPPPPAPKPLIPVASFFDASQRLVWPGEAPVEGDLKEKRDRSDQAMLVVLNETKQQGTASITSVAEARQKLLAYGQPALQAARRDQTPRIAENFHSFLLELYESLAQAATPPQS
jgi:hypothetical protein